MAQNQSARPPVIVSSLTADERLWAEVLDLGGYDLLMTPFDATEIQNVVCMACRERQNEMERSRARELTAKASEECQAAAAIRK